MKWIQTVPVVGKRVPSTEKHRARFPVYALDNWPGALSGMDISVLHLFRQRYTRAKTRMLGGSHPLDVPGLLNARHDANSPHANGQPCSPGSSHPATTCAAHNTACCTQAVLLAYLAL
jgi:hypothetical protein